MICLYTGSKSRVCAAGGTSELLDINVRVHQRSTLSSLLFVLVTRGGDKVGSAGRGERATL